MIESDEFDAIVFGAGPAGACVAANLAPLRRVLLVERAPMSTPILALNETLVPAVRRLFSNMGLWEAFCAEGHDRWYANLSVWGDTTEVVRQLVGDIDGNGWHLDRGRFDHWLRGVARQRGATLFVASRVLDAHHEATGWRVRIDIDGRQTTLRSRILVDATGRRAAIGRRIGARRVDQDRLIARWVRLEGRSSDAGTTFVQSDEEGWWYVAQTRDSSTVAFFTDADLPGAERLDGYKALLDAASAAGLAKRFKLAEAIVRGSGTRAAHSGTLAPSSGAGWLAVGDAAASFDPLGARGIFTALVCGLAAAEACDRYLSDDASTFEGYETILQGILAAYCLERDAAYAAETRWTNMPFWHRRQARHHPPRRALKRAIRSACP